MRRYRGYEIRTTGRGWEIEKDGKTTGTVCDSGELARRVIDDRIRSGRWSGEAEAPEQSVLEGQMSIDDMLGR